MGLGTKDRVAKDNSIKKSMVRNQDINWVLGKMRKMESLENGKRPVRGMLLHASCTPTIKGKWLKIHFLLTYHQFLLLGNQELRNFHSP